MTTTATDFEGRHGLSDNPPIEPTFVSILRLQEEDVTRIDLIDGNAYAVRPGSFEVLDDCVTFGSGHGDAAGSYVVRLEAIASVKVG